MRSYRAIILWTMVSLVVGVVLAVAGGWWALTYRTSHFSDFLSADTAWAVAKVNRHGRDAASMALNSAQDDHSRVRDPAWRALIQRKLRGSVDDQMLILNLLRNAFSYGAGWYEQGIDPPEREFIGQLASSTDVAIDPAVRLAARRCWRGNDHYMGEQAYQLITSVVLMDDPVPNSPISPDGWRPGHLGVVLFRGDLMQWVDSDGALDLQVRSKSNAIMDNLINAARDRRDQILLFSNLLNPGGYEDEAVQEQRIATLAQRLFADAQWLDDIWERDTTTALLLARIHWHFNAFNWPQFQAHFDRYYAGTIRWCLAQDPHRLPEWRANGQVVPAGDLERFGAWLVATRQVFEMHTWSPEFVRVPEPIRRLAAPITLPLQVEVMPDPQRCSPFGLSLTMQQLWREYSDPHGQPRSDWRQWDLRTREWVELRQTMTPDHRGLHGTWPTRGEVDSMWETLFMGTISDGAPSDLE